MRSRSNLLFVLGVVGILIVVGIGYFASLERDVSPAPQPPQAAAAVEPVLEAPPQRLEHARLTQAIGVVQIKVGNDWKPAQVGVEVSAGTDLRTPGESKASVSYGDDIRLEVMSDTEVRLERLDDEVARFIVGEGVVIADVRPESGRVLQLAAKNSDAVVESRDGTVHVLTDGTGHVQAAVTRGEATLTAKGETVQLPAGFQSTVAPGKGPQYPMAIPKSLLLKVKWPDESTSKRRHVVTGTTSPGTRVRVGETIVTADDRGRFRALVDFKEGRNELHVHALDVLGRQERSDSPAIEVDTQAPAHRFETDPNMWKRDGAR